MVDTGPLVAYFCANEARHNWAVQQFANLTPPLLTCEPVLTETCFLLTREKVEAWRLLESLGNGALRVALRLDAEAEAVRGLMSRYSNIPMSLADACVVRLAEISGLPVCTLDSDFTIYRVSGRKRLALILPHREC
ncbi:MAG TPA: PIN domain-containing protein [Stellaceae bacterium]|nr:PIN domain-containing protein [Stellaceae bacterium]